jgi:photosystem II stability/assembly factor-like uncharacterized protein
MRRLLPLIILILLLAQTGNAQWILQQSGTTGNLFDVKFVNLNTGFISGYGKILKTTNSGDNWIQLTIPTQSIDKPLYTIHPVNENIVYCVGGFEAIIKSTDGGNTWSVISDTLFGTGSTYFTCFFVNENTGWVSGSGDKVLKTTNSGVSFDTTHLEPSAGFIKQMYFRNETDGIITGESSTVLKTTNAGLTWDSVNIPVGTTGYALYSLTFSDESTGWTISSSRKVFKTTDFGSNWDSLGRVPMGSNQISCADFPSNDTGYASGQITYKTTNGGLSWIQEVFSPQENNGSIFFINNQTGWACGSGRIYKTTTGGEQLVHIQTVNNNIPEKLILSQNYPNPFNPETTIEYSIPHNENVNIKIYDQLGRQIDEIVNSYHSAGTYSIRYNAEHLSSGIYFFVLISKGKALTKKFILVK